MIIKDISRWESCRLEDRKTELPRTSGIYAITEKGKIFYIGRSGDLNKRWRSHHRYSQAERLKDPRIAWIILDKNKINRAEKVCIEQYRPAWNGTKVKSKSTWFVTSLKMKLIALGVAAIAGICVGLLSLRFTSPPSPSITTPSQKQVE